MFDKNISEETRSNIAKRRGNNIKTFQAARNRQREIVKFSV